MQHKHTPTTSPGSQDSNGIARRNLLKGAMGLGAAAMWPGCASLETSSRSDRVQRENQKPGTRDWMLKNTRIDLATKYRCPWIEGFCSDTSLRAGETIRFFVSANPASAFTIDLYRMGYYGGIGGRHLLTVGPFHGTTQADPPIGPKRVRDCQWEPCASLKIPRDWLSGVYLGKLTAEREGLQSYVIFILRDVRSL